MKNRKFNAGDFPKSHNHSNSIPSKYRPSICRAVRNLRTGKAILNLKGVYLDTSSARTVERLGAQVAASRGLTQQEGEIAALTALYDSVTAQYEKSTLRSLRPALTVRGKLATRFKALARKQGCGPSELLRITLDGICECCGA